VWNSERWRERGDARKCARPQSFFFASVALAWPHFEGQASTTGLKEEEQEEEEEWEPRRAEIKA
jgi:hypothetical protein